MKNTVTEYSHPNHSATLTVCCACEADILDDAHPQDADMVLVTTGLAQDTDDACQVCGYRLPGTAIRQYAREAFDLALYEGYADPEDRNTFATDLAQELRYAIREGWTVAQFVQGFVR